MGVFVCKHNERAPECDMGLGTLDGIILLICFELG